MFEILLVLDLAPADDIDRVDVGENNYPLNLFDLLDGDLILQ